MKQLDFINKKLDNILLNMEYFHIFIMQIKNLKYSFFYINKNKS